MIKKENEPLSHYTYMKVGGPADILIEATTTDEVISIIKEAKSDNIPTYIIGGGSNTLFTDKGFRGLVIVNKSHACDINADTGTVTVDAGLMTNALVNQTVKAGLGGLAPFLGIPGSIGGAIYNNSHYLDQLIGNYITQCTVYDPASGVRTMNHDELKFAYDYSALQEMSVAILTVTFQLERSNAATQQQIANAALERRRATQPLALPSSGCTFKNFKDVAHKYPKLPAGITSAGALIDHAGLKGMKVGGAEVSQVHANFIVNTDSAVAQDIIDLANKISTIVKERYDLPLEREVFFVNEYGERITA
jgi:UDP-N-acetylmuramate dehydrogenase